MKIVTHKYFNMVEMAFAIAILSIGVMSITSIIPIGVKQSKTSIGNNYASQAAENLQAYMTWNYNYLANRDLSLSQLNSWLVTIPSSKPSETATSTLNAASWGNKTYTNPLFLEGDLFEIASGTGKYGIRVQTTVSTAGLQNYDFTGELLVWKVSLANLLFGGYSTPVADTEIVGINFEISWPVEIPYGKRQKRYYYFEMFNTN